MIRFLQRCLAVFIALQASAAMAQSAYFPPGFSEDVVLDPASGLSVQIASGGKPGAPVLVLIHGLGKHASGDWLPVLPALAQHYRVLVFDLPGFGRSDRPDAVLSPQKYADLVHWLIARHTSEPVFVVGHSLGAAVALLHSHTYPRQVRRLLLIDAAGILQTAVYARHLTRVPDQSDRPLLVRHFFQQGQRIVNQVSGKLQDLTARNADTLTAMAGSERARELLYRDRSNISAALGLANQDFSGVVRDIGTPVWILWGEDDVVAPLRTARALHWLLPRSKLEVLPGVGHVPMSQAPVLATRWLLDSLKEPLPPPAVRTAGPSQGDGVCKGRRDMVFEGRWRSIRLERCANARIENATVGQLVAIRSSVTLDDVSIESDATAVEARRSSITATGLRIAAPRAFKLHGSRVDLAALQVSAPTFGGDARGSLLFFSLGYWCDGVSEWHLHDAWKPGHTALDPQLRKVRGRACSLSS